MEEKQIFEEIPTGKNRFHSAVLTSFSFNFHHFEYQVLKSLKTRWVTNVGILVDSNMLDCSAGLTSAGLRQLTQSYSINGVYCKGAFHPKINFIVGYNELLMIIGSGNITPGGHGKNHETFTSFYADDENRILLPLLLEGWEYIKYLAKELKGFSRERIYTSIPVNCELLNDSIANKHLFHRIDDETEIALLYNDSTSILSQLVNLVPYESIETITIVCPYFDKEGLFLFQLLSSFQNANLIIYLPKEFGLPPTEMQPNKRITFYTWEDTKRGKVTFKGKEAYKRKLHSKVFSFKSKDSNYFLIGSANATIAAFGTLEKRGKNEEFGVLYKTNQRDFMEGLCITESKKIVSLSDYIRIENLNPDTKTRITKIGSNEILSCDLSNLSITIYLRKLVEEELSIAFYNDIGIEILTITDYNNEGKTITFKITFEQLKLNPVYLSLKNTKNEVVSNKQIINRVDKLYDTDPSKENRTIKGLISALELGKSDEFKILDYINDLNKSARSSDTGRLNFGHTYTINNSKAYLEMTYEQAMELSKNKEANTKLSHIHNSIRLWDIISRLFKENIEKSIDEADDEEEDGSVEKSNERASGDKQKTGHTIKNVLGYSKIIRQTEKLKCDYVNAINRINSDQNNVINEISLVQFLIVTHTTTVIHQFTVYDLPYNKESKKYSGYTPDEWRKILEAKYHDHMKEILEAFGRFILLHQLEQVPDDEIRKSKMEDYKQKVLYQVIVCYFLVHKNRAETPLSQNLDLVCLNLFYKLGFPDDKFEEYINSISKSNFETHFNPNNVIKLKLKLLDIYNKIDSKHKHFFHKQHGICLILEKTSSKIYFRSLLDVSIKFELPIKDFI